MNVFTLEVDADRRASLLIDGRDDRVVWSDFENPFRSADPDDPDDADAWDWSGVGPFVFNRRRYEYQLRPR